MPRLTRDQIAWRVAQDIEDGWYVNLGVGMPMMVERFLEPKKEIMLHSENGVLGLGPSPARGQENPDLVGQGGGFRTVIPGGSFFDSELSFAIARGKHLDVAVMGAFQVSQYGDLANWKIVEQKIGGVGGAVDLAVGAKRVWIAMNHTTPEGEPKIVEKCTYPLTARHVASRIYTDMAVVDIAHDRLVLRELAPGLKIGEVQELTGGNLDADNYHEMRLP